MKSRIRVLAVLAPILILGMPKWAGGRTLIYHQDWEGASHEERIGGWISKYDLTIGPGYDPIQLVTDPTVPYSHYDPSVPDDPDAPYEMVHQVMRMDTATNYLSPMIPVLPGMSYSVGAWIRWESGGWPFIGISRYNSSGSPIGLPLYDPGTAPRIIWLIGPDWYPSRGGYDPPGSLVDPVPVNYGWGWYNCIGSA